MPSGPSACWLGHAIVLSATMTGPVGKSSSTWRMMRIDWRISSSRTSNRAQLSASVCVGTSKSYCSTLQYGSVLRRSSGTPAARSTGPVTPCSIAVSASMIPTPRSRVFQMGFS